MSFQLILTLEYLTDTNWRWVLKDAAGRFLADQEVALDVTDPIYESFEDLPGQLSHYENVRPAAEVLKELGEWMGAKVFGKVGEKLLTYEQSPACVVQVRLPPAAQNLLFRPFELAHLKGKPLAERRFRFIYTVAHETDGKPGSAAPKENSSAETLRVLGVFSLPRDATPLNLRQERYRLQKLMREFVQTGGRAVELRLLQYGTTRQLLADVLQEAPGWDVMHFSGHGLEGELILEKPDGTADRIDSEKLGELLRPASSRLKLLTLSACYSGAADLRAARAQIGLEDSSSSETTPAQATNALPSLGQRLAEDLDCAVLAMRYPVLDDFATELVLTLYDRLLDKEQPLPQALQLALADALSPEHNPYLPEFSRLTPLLFGARAADLRLQVPSQKFSFELPQTGVFLFPEAPERFVGRLMPMLNAGKALAPRSGKTGVIFYGMAGAGKTACALELAHHYAPQNLERFTGFVWHKAPEEGRDIADSLTRFALSMENQLPGLKLVGLIDNPEDFQRKALPGLRGLLQNTAILLVIDNLEGLLTSSGDWRDSRWGELLNLLLDHNGLSRLVLTSRRPPKALKSHPRLQAEAIHALSFQESVLLARQLSHLKELFKDAAGQEKLQRILRAAQGHPKLLELADGLAADPAALETQLARDESVSANAPTPRIAFFESGQSDRPQDMFVRELRSWTDGVAQNLTPTARLLAQFLARLEDTDRTQDVAQANWEHFLKRLTGQREEDNQPAPEPAFAQAQAALGEPGFGLETALNQLAQVGLIEMDATTSNTHQQFRLHPGIAEALIRSSPPAVSNAVDKELGDHFLRMFYDGIKTEMQGGGRLVVEGARHSTPYLLRAQRWDEAAILLEQLTQRDTSPETLALAIPLLREIVQKTHGTEGELVSAGVLAVVLSKAGSYNEAEVALRDLIGRSLEQSNYTMASAFASALLNLLYRTSRFEEALKTAEEATGYTRLAGLGQWTLLSGECQRLRILKALGRYTEVLAAVEEHRELIRGLTEESTAIETVNPWNVREILLNIGGGAALHLNQWETVLALNAECVESMRQRGADEWEIVCARFSDYGPFLKLQRYPEARALLEYCRTIFVQENAIYELGNVYNALAYLEDDEGHPTSAVLFEQTALRYKYQSGDPDNCAGSHNNLANYIIRAESGGQGDALAHRLAASVIYLQSSSGYLSNSIRNIALSPLPPAPPSFAQLCEMVEQVEGVRFRELFARLPKRASDGDAAIQAVWETVKAEAGKLNEKRARLNETQAQREALLAGLPEAARAALLLEDQAAFVAAMEQLPPEQQQAVITAMMAMTGQIGSDTE